MVLFDPPMKYAFPKSVLIVTVLLFGNLSHAHARDFILTIGGGYSPSGNQASIEKNVLLLHRVLDSLAVQPQRHDTFFADGKAPGKDVQVIDPTLIPKANQLMAEFFGSRRDLGLMYRDHKVPNVQGALKPQEVKRWFNEIGSTLEDGDRLMIYVTAHGQKSKDDKHKYNTSIAMWDRTSMQMVEFAKLLDTLPTKVDVVFVMVQCYTGGFSHLIFQEGDPDKGLSPQRRVGFCATVHDRPAAGCTSAADESTYVEYSTYFWAALSGMDRTGKPIEIPDYDGDGKVSFDEAHGYTILNADTIDLPVKTSGEYLSIVSRFATDDETDSPLLQNDEPYSVVLKLASPTQRAVLEGLSEKLELSGEERLVDAWKKTRSDRRRGRRSSSSTAEPIRRRIASDLKRRWPELANLMNPKVIELLTTDQEEFIRRIENHPQYKKYREAVAQDESRTSDSAGKVQFERFLRVADNIILAENLRRLDKPDELANYESMVRAEQGSLTDPQPE